MVRSRPVLAPNGKRSSLIQQFRSAGLALMAAVITTPQALSHDSGEEAIHQVTGDCYRSAIAWADSLDDEQRHLGVYDFDEDQRRTWHYLNNLPPVYMRDEGLAFKDMTDAQKVLAHRLIRCGLSSQGYQKATGIMFAETLGWARLPDEGIAMAKRMSDTVGTFDSYWLALFGDPSLEEAWQIQLEGHHLAVNLTLNGNSVSVTPTFLGSRPNVIAEGEFAGWHALGYEKSHAFRLLSDLSDDQLARAVISDTVAPDIFTRPDRLDVFDTFAGLSGGEMTARQRQLLWRVIQEYVRNYAAEIVDDRIAEIARDGIEKVYFAWMGPTTDVDKPAYFRIHGPSIVIEYTNASNLGGRKAPKTVGSGEDLKLVRGSHDLADPNHIHSIYLNPKRYFGRDLLGEHYRDHDHGPGSN